MATSEVSRHALHNRLDEVLGAGEAATLMGYLLPVAWADVATKGDLDVLGSGLRAEMAHLRTELKGEMAGLRTELKGEIGDLRTELKGEMGDLRTAMVGLRADFKDDLNRALVGQTRSFIFSMLGFQITAAGLAVAVVHLL